MTWFVYEMARNPTIQRKLQTELDDVIGSLGRPLVYTDLPKLPYLTRCVHETLRYWPAVNPGTFREIQFDDHIKGSDGEPVMIPKGTQVQIQHWSIHRSKKHWGPTADVYNPEREFVDNELWHGAGFKASNPRTERFLPFTHTPRQCLGMNFAQMEMRIVICTLFRRFNVTLGEETAGVDPLSFAINRPILKPRDGIFVHMTPREGIDQAFPLGA